MQFCSLFPAISSLLLLLLFASNVATVTSADAQISGVRITQLGVLDLGGTGEIDGFDALIDLEQDVCEREDSNNDGVPEVETLEPFSDAIIGIRVNNEYHTTIRIDRVSFSIKQGDTQNRTAKSSKLAPLFGAEIAPGESKLIYSFLLKVADRVKLLPGRSQDIPISSGLKIVTVDLKGQDSNGKRLRVRARSTFSFANYRRCE